MPKSFDKAFKEWVADDSYSIGEDVGEEFFDDLESGPTPDNCSSTTEKDGPTPPTQA